MLKSKYDANKKKSTSIAVILFSAAFFANPFKIKPQ